MTWVAAARAHRPELDGLRGVAIVLVLASHVAFPATDALGWVGVEMFFVLSGFLITGILVAEHQRRGSVSLRAFYVRRLRRLAPALLAVVILVTAVDLIVLHGDAIPNAAAALFYVGNWEMTDGTLLGGLSHTWSLSIEEQFYLVWPLALMLSLRVGGIRLALGLAVTVGVASFLWRTGLWASGVNVQRVYFGSDTRADALMAGCALAVLRTTWQPRPQTVAFAAVAIAAVCLVPVDTNEGRTVMLTAGLATVIVATLVLVSLRGGPLTFGPLVRVGQWSYSLYLWHFPLMAGARALLGYVPWWTIPLSFTAAWLSYRYIERPFRLRHGSERVDVVGPELDGRLDHRPLAELVEAVDEVPVGARGDHAGDVRLPRRKVTGEDAVHLV